MKRSCRGAQEAQVTRRRGELEREVVEREPGSGPAPSSGSCPPCRLTFWGWLGGLAAWAGALVGC